MIPQQSPHEWSAESLVGKAQVYAEEMLTFPHDDWRFTLWSTFALELLARAALAYFSPTLVAESRDSWNHILYSLDIQPKVNNYVPRSITITEVFDRLEVLIQDFTPDLETFGKGHMAKRNEELHSGGTLLASASVASWLPTYYRACTVLLESMGDDLNRFLGSAEAEVAEQMIAAALDESAKSIRGEINAHGVVWNGKSDEERERLAQQSSVWATRHDGHRVSCPACHSNAILTGSAIAPPLKTIDDDEITETQEYLPSRFECVACNLKISGLPQLNASGLGDTYTATFTYDANDHYAYQVDDSYLEYEADFNEPDAF